MLDSFRCRCSFKERCDAGLICALWEPFVYVLGGSCFSSSTLGQGSLPVVALTRAVDFLFLVLSLILFLAEHVGCLSTPCIGVLVRWRTRQPSSGRRASSLVNPWCRKYDATAALVVPVFSTLGDTCVACQSWRVSWLRASSSRRVNCTSLPFLMLWCVEVPVVFELCSGVRLCCVVHFFHLRVAGGCDCNRRLVCDEAAFDRRGWLFLTSQPDSVGFRVVHCVKRFFFSSPQDNDRYSSAHVDGEQYQNVKVRWCVTSTPPLGLRPSARVQPTSTQTI